MASRLTPSARTAARRISNTTSSGEDFLPHLADLITSGEITIGTMAAVGRIATAVDSESCLAMLVRRKGETLHQLLLRLDLAVALAYSEDISTDEVNAPATTRLPHK